MSESNVLKRILLKGSELGVILFRNNCGILPDRRGIPIKFGVGNPGGSDLIGYMSITVTPAMIGRKLAVFCALEVKDTGGKPTPEQINFVERARSAGAIAGIVYSPEEASNLLSTTYCG